MKKDRVEPFKGFREVLKDEDYLEISVNEDDSGHTYIIPIELRDEFDTLWDIEEDYEAQEKWEEKFSKYRTGGCLSNVNLYIKRKDLNKITNND